MSKALSKVSLRDTVLHSIGDFLWKEHFPTDDVLPHGILEIINSIADYQEEGVPLQPHIIITNNIKFFEPFPHKTKLVKSARLALAEFKEAIKICAPLAINGWSIYIEVTGDNIKYGLVSAEITETSLSLYSQTVGGLQVEYDGVSVAYLRKVGKRTVEMSGIYNTVIISLTLDNLTNEGSFSEVIKLSQQIASKCPEKYKLLVGTFFEKIINESLRIGHGNLIAVIDDSEEAINRLKADEPKGTYLPLPIDFLNLFVEAESSPSNVSSIDLSSNAILLQQMLNHDGITILTNTGRVIGFHLVIRDHMLPGQVVDGGSRSKAFASMENCGHFMCCFFKSQDGNTKIFVKNE